MDHNIATHMLREAFPRRVCVPVAKTGYEDIVFPGRIGPPFPGRNFDGDDHGVDTDMEVSHLIPRWSLSALRREICRITHPRRFHGIAFNGSGMAELAKGLVATAGAGVAQPSYSPASPSKYVLDRQCVRHRVVCPAYLKRLVLFPPQVFKRETCLRRCRGEAVRGFQRTVCSHIRTCDCRNACSMRCQPECAEAARCTSVLWRIVYNVGISCIDLSCKNW